MGELIKPTCKELPKGAPASKYIITEYLQEKGFNPAQKYLDIYDKAESAYEDSEDPAQAMAALELQRKILKDVMPYYTPQLKSIDINVHNTEETTLTVNVVQFDGLLKHLPLAPEIVEVTADE